MTNVDGENRLFVCPMWQDGLLTMLFCENKTFRTQILGVRSPAEQGTGDIQRVCLMQTRFRSPHLPPGKRQMPLFSGRTRTKKL